MAFDISEIKKLSIEERLRIIAELWESIESERKQEDEFVVNEEEAKCIEKDEEEESPEIIAMLEERLAEYERGEGNSYTWEEAKAILEKNLEELRRNKNA
jgi:putative addiction module component (TIGR02574 family)